MLSFRSQWPSCVSLAAVLLVSGCRSARTIHDSEYAQLESDVARAMMDSQPALAAITPVASELAGPSTVDEYVAVALSQNPRIQAARKRVEAASYRVPQAASLEDPMLGVNGYPFSPYVLQTAGGRSTANVMASQNLPWLGKLETRSEVAEAGTDVARAELVAAELEIVEQVKRAYYALSFSQQTIHITEQSRGLLVELSEIAEIRYTTGAVSQQDVLRSQVEVSNVDSELIQLRQQLQSTRARLAQLLHVSPETPLQALNEWPEEEVPQDLERLYQQAITARPELHAQLAAVRRDLSQVELARLQYYPDVTLNAMWGGMTTSGALSAAADGVSMFNIGAQINVPLYRKKLQAGVREAEAQAVSSAREYDAMKDRTQAEVKDLFAQALSQRDLVALFKNEIIPKAEQTLEVSLEAYRVGQTDFLQLVDNWRQLLKFRVMLSQQESQLRQTLSTLERVVGGAISSPMPPVPVPGAIALPADPF
ncbi:TolC family protein [Planctellipticum variicoloris]|uniref:TolC family protein n=1 Tax=Planctellipticum variicoloris TaxID=3064265 RepID=UPI003013BCB1|nr:TolC family protein [Planctomycetaceae bacterium SH412]